jgi:hypothetical protein
MAFSVRQGRTAKETFPVVCLIRQRQKRGAEKLPFLSSYFLPPSLIRAKSVTDFWLLNSPWFFPSGMDPAAGRAGSCPPTAGNPMKPTLSPSYKFEEEERGKERLEEEEVEESPP